MYMQLHKVNKRKWEARLNGQDYILQGTKTPHTNHVVWVALRDSVQVGIATRSFQSALEFAMSDAGGAV
jgi:hypothetical protein